MDIGRVIFLTTAVLTHGIVGYTLVQVVTNVNPTIGYILGIVLDVDFSFQLCGEHIHPSRDNTYGSLPHRDHYRSWPMGIPKAIQTGERIGCQFTSGDRFIVADGGAMAVSARDRCKRRSVASWVNSNARSVGPLGQIARMAKATTVTGF